MNARTNTTIAVTQANETQFIALKHLVKSDVNVRTIKDNSYKDLLASIRKVGVIENLIVLKEHDLYGVVAGDRRHSCLVELLDNSEIDGEYLVNCLVADTIEQAHDLSLIENLKRKDMHIVEKLAAFNKVMQNGASVDDIAIGYGMSKKHVNQVLALANVHPTILKAFHKDDINMSAVQAFTVTKDQTKQLNCFKALDWYQPHQIRAMLLEGGHKSDSRIVGFVGKKAYTEANGHITTDMFNDVDTYTDGELLFNLATAKLNNYSDSDASLKGFAWVEVDTLGEYREYDFEQMKGKFIKVPDNLKAKITLHEKELKNTDTKDTKNIRALTKKLNALYERKNKFYVLTEKQKSFSGLVISYDKFNNIVFHRGVAKLEDYKKYLKATAKPKKITANDTQQDNGLSQALKDSLTGFDNQLFQLNLLQHPSLCAESFIFETCYRLLSASEQWIYGIFDASVNTKISHDELLCASKAYSAIKTAREAINTSWLNDSVKESYSAFTELSAEDQHTILGQATALSCIASSPSYTMDSTTFIPLLERTTFTKSDYWMPTKANFFGRVSLPYLQNICTELFGEAWLSDKQKLSKGKLAEIAEETYAKLDADKQTFIPDYINQ